MGVASACWVALAEHPRLFLTSAELPALRALKEQPSHATIWQNMKDSAEWCLEKTPRREYIAPIAEDPVYENLYDRFYAMMMDMAITEHLAFAYALSGDERYGDAARAWVLASCRAWKPDADAAPDGGKAYAVMRLLKGVATGYDLVYERFTDEERAEIRAMLETTARNYFVNYFSDATHSGPDFHTHHAVVEYSSFGVAALALLGEVDDAPRWVEATTHKFREHLLPKGLAVDGAQIEGATFWASTMHYRMFYLDALKRVTGVDLISEARAVMRAELAYASIAAERVERWDEPNQTVVLSPSYGQLNYYAPALLFLARAYGDTTSQYLAKWDRSLGTIQKTRYVTPNRREQLLFELGGYAYLWLDPSVEAKAVAPLSYRFPSVGQVYLRENWEVGGIVVALEQTGQLVVHAGGLPVVVVSGGTGEYKALPELKDDESTSTASWLGPDGRVIEITVRRPGEALIRVSGTTAPWEFWSLRTPDELEGGLRWGNGVKLEIHEGAVAKVEDGGYAPVHAVGNGKLRLVDPEPRTYPLVHVVPSSAGVVLFSIWQP